MTRKLFTSLDCHGLQYCGRRHLRRTNQIQIPAPESSARFPVSITVYCQFPGKFKFFLLKNRQVQFIQGSDLAELLDESSCRSGRATSMSYLDSRCGTIEEWLSVALTGSFQIREQFLPQIQLIVQECQHLLLSLKLVLHKNFTL